MREPMRHCTDVFVGDVAPVAELPRLISIDGEPAVKRVINPNVPIDYLCPRPARMNPVAPASAIALTPAIAQAVQITSRLARSALAVSR
jgi:hypothetical protein